ALRHPDRVKGVGGMSVPFVPRGPMAPIPLFTQLFGDNFFYILYFQEPGVAEAELEADPYDTMRRTLVGISSAGMDAAAALTTGARHKDTTKFLTHFANPDTLPAWLSEDELRHFADEFAHSGFRGPLNYYRNMDRNWELNESFTGAKVELPALFVTGADDPVRRMAPDAFLDEWVPGLRGKVIIDGAGHWVQQEKPAETNAAVLEFLAGL
ncbi:MAG TPA: alpha/beta hydrolase, partial [Acidimicrobiales bacterium]|nr:alpha/beta hydrolase [Acidimicrobiales bacterium]